MLLFSYSPCSLSRVQDSKSNTMMISRIWLKRYAALNWQEIEEEEVQYELTRKRENALAKFAL